MENNYRTQDVQLITEVTIAWVQNTGGDFTHMKPVMHLFTLAVQGIVARFTASLCPIFYPSDHSNPNLDLNLFVLWDYNK